LFAAVRHYIAAEGLSEALALERYSDDLDVGICSKAVRGCHRSAGSLRRGDSIIFPRHTEQRSQLSEPLGVLDRNLDRDLFLGED